LNKQAIKGSTIVAESPKYDEVVLYPLGAVESYISGIFSELMDREERLGRVIDLYDQSESKYPDSWWVKQLSPFIRTKARHYAVVSRLIRAYMLEELDRLERTNGRNLRLLTQPDLIFGELRTYVQDWEREIS